MSSHHIVRDNQEPALILQGIQPPLHLVQELLEWAPTVVVSEESLEEVLTWGIKIDAVIHRSSQQELEAKIEHQQPVQLIMAATEGNLVASLRYLAIRRHVTVNIVCSSIEWSTIEAFKEQLTIVVYSQSMRWSFIRSGHVEKFVPSGTMYSLRINDVERHHSSDAEKIKVELNESFWLGERLDY